MVRTNRFPEVLNFRMPQGSRKRLKTIMKLDERQGVLLRTILLDFIALREEQKSSTTKETKRK